MDNLRGILDDDEGKSQFWTSAVEVPMQGDRLTNAQMVENTQEESRVLESNEWKVKFLVNRKRKVHMAIVKLSVKDCLQWSIFYQNS